MRRTILLADDSPTIQRLVTNTFADLDFEIISVSNGEAAIRKFDDIHPHVVLADIYMPGKTGYEVCTHVRQDPTAGTTPVILLVGAFDAFDEEKARELGANAHITKPFEPQALVSLVESVLPPEEVRADDTSASKSFDPDQTILQPPAAHDNVPVVSEDDLLGLEALFQEPAGESRSTVAAVTESDIDRIADRVIQRISTQVIESIAWEIVPDITERIVREEFKRNQ